MATRDRSPRGWERRSSTWARGCGPLSASSRRSASVTQPGAVPQPQGSGTAMIAPYQAFPTADGFAMVGAASDALFARLAAVLGCPELAADERFKDNPSRVSNRAALVETLSKRTRERKAAELVETLRASGVPAAPILTVDQMLEEPQTRDSGVLVGASHPRLP